MKLILTSLLLVSYFCSHAQNVGIGTREPKNKLHVAGGLRVDSLSNNKDSGLILHNKAGDVYSLKFTGNKSDVLHGDGSFSAAAAVTDAWLLGGNAGTDSNVNFLGTTDKKPLMFRINNQYYGTFSDNNIAIGHEALGFNFVNQLGPIGGMENVAIGTQALWNTGANRNVGVGYYTIKDIRGDNNTAIGTYALVGRRSSQGVIGTGNDNVAIGTFALASMPDGSMNTAVGVRTLNGVGNFNRPIIGNTAVGYQAMRNYAPDEGPSDGYNVAVGAESLFSNKHGAHNTAIGFHSIYSDISAWRLTAVGFNALRDNVGGAENTAVGHTALAKNTTGSNNTSTGTYSLSNNTTGSNNTANGQSALASNSSGRNNTAAGNLSLRSNTTGIDNTSLGQASLQASTTANYNTSAGSQTLFATTTGSYNSAYGFKAMFTNTTGANNTAAGFKALNFNTTGSNNTAAGFEALNKNTTGTNNTAIGYRADVTATNFTNATAIGFDAKVNASNKVRIGNAAVTKIEGQVPFTTPSDGRYKFNVKEDVKGLAFIMKLRPVTYQFDVSAFDKRSNASFASNSSYAEAAMIKRTGFIAQEVDNAAQQADYNFSGIVRPDSDNDHYSLSYESFVVPLVKAVQEQQVVIKTLEHQIDGLLKRINALENQNK